MRWGSRRAILDSERMRDVTLVADHRRRLAAALWMLAVLFALTGCAAGGFLTAPAPTAQDEASAGAVAAEVSAPLPERPVRFEQLSIDEGLSESVVRAILQDREGFLWFATDDGLNRFDGSNFLIYKNDPEDANSLGHNQITSMIEDRSGGLWLGSYNSGLTYFNRQVGVFTRYRHNQTRADSLSANRVNAVLEDRDGVIWVATSGGLNRFDAQTGAFDRFQNQPDRSTSLSSDVVYSLADGGDGTLWVGTMRGLDHFDPRTGVFTHYKEQEGDPTSLSGEAVLALHMSRSGQLWVGSYGGGVQRFQPESGNFVKIPLKGAAWSAPEEMKVSALYEDRAGVLWVGTMGEGLCRLLRGEQHLTCFGYTQAPGGLNAEDVLSLYEDRSGILWIGTFGGGVNKIDPGYRPFETLRSNPDDPNSLSGGMVFALLKDRQDNLWIGADGTGLDRVNRRTGRVTHFRHDAQDLTSLSSDEVRVLYQDRTGVLWIGTGVGLDRYDPLTEAFIHFVPAADLPDRRQGVNVVGLAEDTGGRFWVLTNKALFLMDREAGTFRAYQNDKEDPNSLAASSYTTLYADSYGLLWVGTVSRGIDRFDPITGRAAHYLHNPDDPRSLSDAYVMNVREDSSGTLWVGTTSGLNRYDRTSGSFRRYRTRDGLPNDFIYAILEDEQGRLWVSTNKGLSRYNPRTGEFKNFDSRDGLQSNEFNMGAAAKGSDGEMFFGGIDGVNAFYPDQIRDNPYLPPVTMTAFTSRGETLSVDPRRPQEFTLRWPDNAFEFEFAALNYTRPENNRHAYMLEGFDHKWNEIGGRRSGRYTNLPGGRYTLRLKGSNNDGLWNETGASVIVQVIPPFWATWWFRGASALLAVGVVFGTVRVRVRGMESRNSELERLVRARTVEIERLYRQTKELAVMEERNRLARDLHDSAKQKAFAALAQLGAANGLVRADPARARAALGEAETLVYEVIEDLTFLIQDMYPAALKEKGLPALLSEYMYEWESRSGIQVCFSMENERRLALQIEQALYRVIQEALANVARHSKARCVVVALRYAGGRVEVRISDDGLGYDLSANSSGVGLRSMHERIALIGGEMEIESAPGKGTCVSFSAPDSLAEVDPLLPAEGLGDDIDGLRRKNGGSNHDSTGR